MKKSIKNCFALMFCLAFTFVAYASNANAATNRHYCIKYTCSSTYYGVTADVTLPSSIYVPNNGNYTDWYIGMDPTSGSYAVEGGISYKAGTFRVFLNTAADSFSVPYSSIKTGQKVNLKIRLSSDGKSATLYLNGTQVERALSTKGTFQNGKGYPKIVMGVEDNGTSYHSTATINNVKVCANSAGSSYTNMTSSMGKAGIYTPNGSSNPYSKTSSFPLTATLNKQ